VPKQNEHDRRVESSSPTKWPEPGRIESIGPQVNLVKEAIKEAATSKTPITIGGSEGKVIEDEKKAAEIKPEDHIIK
jgi:hypothetical protein